MSTTFGIKIPENEEIIEVAYRTNGKITWLNCLTRFLPDDTEVIPLDNTAQGIYTIGDIRTYNIEQK